jgi:hypothetical protein
VGAVPGYALDSPGEVIEITEAYPGFAAVAGRRAPRLPS